MEKRREIEDRKEGEGNEPINTICKDDEPLIIYRLNT